GINSGMTTEEGEDENTTNGSLEKEGAEKNQEKSATLIETSKGTVRGKVVGSARVFSGIPFADPPLGALRWRPPQPVSPWEGILDATKYKSSCTQAPGTAVGSGDEDCLYLNVIVPNKKAPREGFPVQVFIHGGSNVRGGALSISKGKESGIMQGFGNDSILVTINYRLGPLGFMTHPALAKEDPQWPVSGNYGILDQIAALKWVQKEIAAFGGDPDRVGLSGNSAGAVDSLLLMMSPLAEGLFDAVWASSGVIGEGRTMKENEVKTGLTTEHLTGCDKASDPLVCLRSVSAEKLVSLSRSNGMPIGQVVDGIVYPDHSYNLIARGEYTHVPVMGGSQTHDRIKKSGPVTLANLDALISLLGEFWSIFGLETEEEIRRTAAESASIYEKAEPDKSLTEIGADMHSDLVFLCGFRRIFDDLARQMPGSVYWYRFEYTLPPDEYSRHNYAFKFYTGQVAAGDNPNPMYEGGHYTPTKDDLTLTTRMNSWFTNLIETGNPNASGLPTWQPFESSPSGSALVMNAEPYMSANFRNAQCDYWDQFYNY
ncbi:MAG: carboxylesterase/lipase family protein, partial [Candidatus Binatia bacterium]